MVKGPKDATQKLTFQCGQITNTCCAKSTTAAITDHFNYKDP